MKTFLKVLVIILLLLSIAALTFGVMLFMKRELLKGRTQRLEKAVKEFDAVIEAVPAVMDPVPKNPELDISRCEAEIPETLEFNNFFASYKYNLEAQADVMVNTSSRNQELMSYFVTDAAGNKRIKGPGTMDNVLVELRTKAEAQYNLLNETREQLTALRKELISTIEKHNAKMMDHRHALIKIKELEALIEQLREQIATLEAKVAELEAQIQPLKDQIAEQEKLLAEQEEQITEKDREIERLTKLAGDKPSPDGSVVVDMGGRIEPGVKGEIVLVNKEWQFCVFRMTDQMYQEITGGNPDADIPQIDLWVKRLGDDGKIVSKIRMLQVKREQKLATADIMTDWQQLPLQQGDVVFFQ